jgi:hypothetical protein
MAVRGRILQGQPVPTLMVSQDAVYESKLGLVVFRMTPPGPNDKPPMEGMPPLPSFENVPIEAGERIDGMAVITKGELKPGDMLITRGKEALYPTAKIIPTNLQGGAGGAAPAGAEGASEGEGAAPGQEEGSTEEPQPEGGETSEEDAGPGAAEGAGQAGGK